MDYDQEFCGKATAVRKLTTSKPRLLLIFSANGSLTGRGFKAKYQFVTGNCLILQSRATCKSLRWNCRTIGLANICLIPESIWHCNGVWDEVKKWNMKWRWDETISQVPRSRAYKDSYSYSSKQLCRMFLCETDHVLLNSVQNIQHSLNDMLAATRGKHKCWLRKAHCFKLPNCH